MSVALEPSRRERKKQATRQAVHRAAFELADRVGLAGTTVEAISDRAGIAPRTFWSYFASKEDAVIDRDPEWPLALRAGLLERPPTEDVVTSLQVVLGEHIGGRLTDSARSVRRQNLIRREPSLMAAVAAVYDELERALVLAVAERLGTDPEQDMLPAVAVAAACGACRVAQQRWAGLGGAVPYQEVLEEAFAELASITSGQGR
jgi:AcrR family transcriptional regulator